jgi:hypothetical protein
VLPSLKGDVSQVGSAVVVPLIKTAGLGLQTGLDSKDNPVVLHVRGDTKSTVDKMLSKTRKVWVHGPPGTGKSCSAWVAALVFAETNPTLAVLWVHVSRAGEVWIVLIKDKHHVSFNCIKGDLLSTQGLIYKGIRLKFDLAVVDGVTQETQGELCGWIAQATKPSGVFRYVSSASLKLGVEDLSPESAVKVNCWTFEQYVEACKDHLVWQHVRSCIGSRAPAYGTAGPCSSADSKSCADLNCACKDTGVDALVQKYEVAGHSARWMFLLSTDQVIADADQWISRCANFEVLSQGLNGAAANENSGHLIAVIPNTQQRTFMSHYVARALGSLVERQFIVRAYSASPDNAAFCGWVLEMDMLHRMRKEDRVVIVSCDGKDVDLKSAKPEPVRYRSVTQDFQKEMAAGKSVCGIPQAPNQGCFDLFVLEAHNTGQGVTTYKLRCIQVTWSNTHTCKMRFVTSLLKELKQAYVIDVTHVEMMFVVRKGKQADFRVPQDAKKPSLVQLRDRTLNSVWNNIAFSTAAYGFDTAASTAL